jgi:hypothetical protein
MQAGGHDDQQEEVPGSGFGGWRKMLGRWRACHGGWRQSSVDVKLTGSLFFPLRVRGRGEHIKRANDSRRGTWHPVAFSLSSTLVSIPHLVTPTRC